MKKPHDCWKTFALYGHDSYRIPLVGSRLSEETLLGRLSLDDLTLELANTNFGTDANPKYVPDERDIAKYAAKRVQEIAQEAMETIGFYIPALLDNRLAYAVEEDDLLIDDQGHKGFTIRRLPLDGGEHLNLSYEGYIKFIRDYEAAPSWGDLPIVRTAKKGPRF